MPDSLKGRVHRNVIEVTALMSARSERVDGGVLLASTSEMPFLNCVLRDGDGGDPDGLIERAQEFFFGLGRGFVVYTWPGDPALAQAAGRAGLLTVVERYPEMVCRSPIARPAAEVRPVTDLDGARAYWAICDAAYPSLGFPAGLFAQAFSAEQLLGLEGTEACIAVNHGKPVACAMLVVRGGVGFIGWVASIPQARGRGYAAACTAWATNRAFELGAEVASLQASSMGEDLYRRLGYEELFSYRLMGAMPSTNA